MHDNALIKTSVNDDDDGKQEMDSCVCDKVKECQIIEDKGKVSLVDLG